MGMDEFRVICYCISHFSMMCFLLAFTQRRYSMRKTVGILLAAFAMLSGLEILHDFLDSSEQAYSIIVILQILILQSVTLLISEYRDFRALFTGLMSSNYVLPGVMSSVYMYVLTEWMQASVVYEILMNGVLLWMLIYLLRPIYLEIQREGRGEWMNMCLMPSLFYISAQGLDLVAKGSGKPMKAMLAVMFFLATMYIAYILVFRMIGALYREQQTVREQEILKAGIRALRHELDEMRETERKITDHVRDKQRLIRIMQGLMEKRDYDGINQILEEMQEMTVVSCPVRYTHNAAVNGVLVSYAAEAASKEIEFAARLELPEKLRVNDWQLAVVIGNLLDNAIRACEGAEKDTLRRIRVTARQRHGQVLIEIRNTCGKKIVFDPETGLPVSQRGEGHGIGMHSVAYFAEKNQVTFSCGVQRGEFFARILI